ncbi:glycosyltransferase family 2 protein [Proteus faecis]|uniref:glycosyltransferase family 2 protein n=1 Tax=Proteus faecis TaxID=2050967 RepID=UPI000D6854C9|nr:glycosyltransferase family 2 protein [Proteus faecis]
MNIKYSIIIPAFNAESYLTKIISFSKKILKKREDIEIIFVDDGSIDNTSSIQNKSENIKYIYQENGGVSSARNLGLKSAIGEFILFLDADDTYDDNIFSVLDVFTTDEQSNIFLLNYSINKKIQNDTLSLLNKNIFNWMEVSNMFFKREIKLHICAVCFRKKHLLSNSIFFPNGYSFGEDSFFILSSIYNEQKIHYIKNSLYNYNFHHGSVVSTPLNKNKIDVIELYLTLREEKYKENKVIIYFIERTYLYLLKLAIKYGIRDKETMQQLKKYKFILNSKNSSRNIPFNIIKFFIYNFNHIIIDIIYLKSRARK